MLYTKPLNVFSDAEHKASNILKNDQTIIILSADKRRVKIILDSNDYTGEKTTIK